MFQTRLAAAAIVAASTGAVAQSVPATPTTSLAPITVTATRFPESAADLPLGVNVVTAAQIKASGATTVNEAIMKLLGVPGRLDFYGGGDYALDLRAFGTTADNNQVVVVDGIRVSEADLGGTRLAGIAIDSVERIEVIRGSGAVLYGEGATGGVIAITTKAGRGLARQSQADVYAAAGSREQANLTVPELIDAYPSPDKFGDLPGVAVYARHVRGLDLDHVRVSLLAPDSRPAFYGQDVVDLDVEALNVPFAAGAEPLLRLFNVRQALIRASALWNAEEQGFVQQDSACVDIMVKP